MTYAQIKDGVIVNRISLDDDSLVSLFSAGFDYCIRVDNISPEPQIGWLYDGVKFSEPDQQ